MGDIWFIKNTLMNMLFYERKLKDHCGVVSLNSNLPGAEQRAFKNNSFTTLSSGTDIQSEIIY